MKKRRRNQGAMAVEFGLVFPLLFMMMYAILQYSLIFALQHSVSLASAEAARSAVRFQTSSDSINVRTNAACLTAKEILGWVESLSKRTADCVVDGAGAGLFSIHVSSKNTNANCINANSECIAVNIVYQYKNGGEIIPALLPVPSSISSRSYTDISLRY